MSQKAKTYTTLAQYSLSFVSRKIADLKRTLVRQKTKKSLLLRLKWDFLHCKWELDEHTYPSYVIIGLRTCSEKGVNIGLAVFWSPCA